MRFELPFNIWCSSCGVHLAQGRRFNARKSQVGEYLSTKIWSFRCKCVCGHFFDIRTDPKNAQYEVGEGAKRQVQEWDPVEHGGHAVYDSEEKKEKGEDGDAFAQLERNQTERKKGKEREERIFELEELSKRTGEDPYTVNAGLRKGFRKEKRKRTEQLERDLELKKRIGWQDDRLLLPSTPESEERDRKLWRQRSSARKGGERKEGKTAAQELAERVVANSRKKRDPFLASIGAEAAPSFSSTKRKDG